MSYPPSSGWRPGNPPPGQPGAGWNQQPSPQSYVGPQPQPSPPQGAWPGPQQPGYGGPQPPTWQPPPTPPRQRSNAPLLIAILVGVVVLGIAVGVLVVQPWRGRSTTSTSPSTATPSTSGAPLDAAKITQIIPLTVGTYQYTKLSNVTTYYTNQTFTQCLALEFGAMGKELKQAIRTARDNFGDDDDLIDFLVYPSASQTTTNHDAVTSSMSSCSRNPMPTKDIDETRDGVHTVLFRGVNGRNQNAVFSWVSYRNVMAYGRTIDTSYDVRAFAAAFKAKIDKLADG